jgi:hypothetical protein
VASQDDPPDREEWLVNAGFAGVSRVAGKLRVARVAGTVAGPKRNQDFVRDHRSLLRDL